MTGTGQPMVGIFWQLGNRLIFDTSPLSEAEPSVITLKPAIRYQFKTGQRDWPKT
jgi:hypothetical protein